MFPYDERAAVLEQCRNSSKKEGLALESAVDLWWVGSASHDHAAWTHTWPSSHTVVCYASMHARALAVPACQEPWLEPAPPTLLLPGAANRLQGLLR